VIRQQQAQSDAGPSIITTPPRAVEPSISTSFIASMYMERVMRYSEENNIQRRPPEKDSPRTPKTALHLGQTRRRTHLPPATPPNSLLAAPQSTSASTAKNYCHNSTHTPDIIVPTLRVPVAAVDFESHSRVGSNEQVDSGIEEVKLFLENCSPSMVHHLDSFIKAGVKNGEYLKAVDRLCVSDSNALSSVLESSDLSMIDSILLRDYLHRWVEERKCK
jgi:hypothetical protein